MDTLGERLRFLRGECSQSDFSAKLCIPQTTLSRYERNKSQPDLEFIRQLCDTLAVSVEWFITGRGPARREESASKPEPVADTPCPQCRRMEAELQEERRERRALNDENRRLWQKTELLWKENSELRERLVRAEQTAPPPLPRPSTKRLSA